MSRRVQLALNVNDIDQAVAFYSKLFGTEPAKRRPGYANFAITEPPLKLVLLENPGQGGSLNHLGVEVTDTDAVDAEQTRLAGTGLASVDTSATRPAATPGRTSSGFRERPTGSPGRSTPSWPTARPSTTMATRSQCCGDTGQPGETTSSHDAPCCCEKGQRRTCPGPATHRAGPALRGP